VTPPTSGRRLPVDTCAACGGVYFRLVNVHAFETKARELVRGLGYEDQHVSIMPMTLLICLCGAPLQPNIGGVRGGPTANHEISQLVESFDHAARQVEARHDTADVYARAARDLAPRERLSPLLAEISSIEREVAQLLARKEGGRRRRGAPWRLPRREPATRGHDRLALDLQKRGLTFDEARRVVGAMFEAMLEALKRGEAVTTSLGTFRAQARTKRGFRIRLGRLQQYHPGKKIVFEPSGDLVIRPRIDEGVKS
jgi:nucleoid DNA-binding protein